MNLPFATPRHAPRAAHSGTGEPTPGRAFRLLCAAHGHHYGFLQDQARLGERLSHAARVHVLPPALAALSPEGILPAGVVERLREGESPIAFTPAEQAGLGAGMAMQFRNSRGGAAFLVLLDASPPRRAPEPALFLADATRFCALHFAAAGGRPSLKPREVDCLTWAAAGKTAEDIATILGLSVHTVNQHLASATAALGATNRVHAVARAVHFGIVSVVP